MQLDGDSYYYNPKHFTVDSSLQAFYEPFTVKKLIGQYLVCNDYMGTSNSFEIVSSGLFGQGWYNLHYLDFDFGKIWTPLYAVPVDYTLTMIVDKFGDGYKLKSQYGINLDIILWDIHFDLILNLEAKSLLIFLEFKGGVGTFKYKMPLPYNSTKYFRITSALIQFVGFDQNNVRLKFQEIYLENGNIVYQLGGDGCMDGCISE